MSSPAKLAGEALGDVDGLYFPRGRSASAVAKSTGHHLHASAVFVTWSQSRIEDHDEFYRQLRELMPGDAEIFGAMERHQDGSRDYYAVVKFASHADWRKARAKFVMRATDGEEDTAAIRFVPLKKGQRLRDFVRNKQKYCVKNREEFTFGKRIEILTAAEAKKRKYQEVIDEPDYEKTRTLLIELHPAQCVTRYSNIQSYLDGEKAKGPPGGCDAKEGKDWKPWVLPPGLEEWKQQNIVSRPKGTRAVPLILIGPSRLGKTEWAVHAADKPIVMSGSWNLRNYIAEATHVVLSDVNFRSFGHNGSVYWRGVLGCQDGFDASDKYMKRGYVKWDLLAIVTCNKDNDPRKVPEIAEYLQHAPVVVVEIVEPLFEQDAN